IIVGLLWNLRWPGLVVAIAAMAVITYWVVQWSLGYLPRLQKELDREPRWSRRSTWAVALVLFVLGMLSAIGFQATLGDIFSSMQIFAGPSDLWTVTEEEQRAKIDQSHLDQLKGSEIVSQELFGKFLISQLLLHSLWAPLFLWCSIACLIHT